MVKRLTSVVALSLLVLGALAFAQQPGATTARTPEAASIKAAAEISSRAFMSGDFARLLDLTYPKLIELGGGREKMLAAIEGQLKEMRDEGMKIVSHTIGEPEPSVRAGSQLVAIVPVELGMESSEYIIRQKSFWLAVSEDEGKTWKFLSGGSLSEDVLKLLLPEAAGKITLPAEALPSMKRKTAKPKAGGASRRKYRR
ncbi:MAG TPA: hypothetical protein VER76_13645 [Pyrinomonadaceae bacterium]|nr:hypothetical protein [Pyrinomonadaceae bacterium]